MCIIFCDWFVFRIILPLQSVVIFSDMFLLKNKFIEFPPVKLANSQGILAYGGDLSVDRLKEAYRNGIFPWYNENEFILWWAPDPRMVLFPEEINISKSMRSLIRKGLYTITENKAFKEVIENCSEVHRKVHNETWLHPEMQQAYIDLFKKGLAFSVEVWNNKGNLVGGLYGVKSSDTVWSGESMFHLESNTSKLAFIHLANQAQKNNVEVIDCQIYTDHLASMGAREIPRSEFMSYL